MKTENAATDVNANAAAAVVAPAPAPKEPTKMDKARALFLTLKEADYVVPEGSSIRKEFISKAQVAFSDGGIGLTKNGAITYYNNLQNEAKGKPLYIKPTKAATVGQVQGAEAQVAQTEETKAGDALADLALTGQSDDAPVDTQVDDEENKAAE